jgi:hypothetical protein
MVALTGGLLLGFSPCLGATHKPDRALCQQAHDQPVALDATTRIAFKTERLVLSRFGKENAKNLSAVRVTTGGSPRAT